MVDDDGRPGIAPALQRRAPVRERPEIGGAGLAFRGLKGQRSGVFDWLFEGAMRVKVRCAAAQV
jgi:hypothetical protein